ncbi:MAG: peptidylprolyl isomerase [Planctomycetes bacterium]|nr:peptidylprolyl isomerase [Planctomycetota bacterium]MBZ0151668.1 peptidylprolyl isomerase [Planctomycetota bacterium]MCC7396315.1 peptidylprolyl isomerase [Planctomycetota bacterium]
MDLDQTDPATIEAAVVTDKGTLVVTFFPEQAPRHVRAFLTLAQQGFYDGVAFHRIVRNFMIQTGCPHSKKGGSGMPGTGGPGYTLPAEFNDIPHTRGVLSMARARDPNSAGSQFFIVHADHADFLDGQYTVFGKVEAGLDVLDGIAGIECDFGPGGERSKPKTRVEIQRIELRPRQQREPATAQEA